MSVMGGEKNEKRYEDSIRFSDFFTAAMRGAGTILPGSEIN